MIKVIFCAFNEEKSLDKFLTDLGATLNGLKSDGGFEIIACLDCTTDNSMQIIAKHQQALPLRILPQLNVRGLGVAYKRIFTEVIKNSSAADIVISLDADNTHDPADIAEMLKVFQSNKLDFLVASRFSSGSSMIGFPWYRKLISKSVSILLQTLFAVRRVSGKKLQDYTSGYRLYRVQKLQELFAKKQNDFITEPEFTYTCELLINLARVGARIDEISFPYDYGQKIGESKLRFMRNMRRLILLVIKLKFNRF